MLNVANVGSFCFESFLFLVLLLFFFSYEISVESERIERQDNKEQWARIKFRMYFRNCYAVDVPPFIPFSDSYCVCMHSEWQRHLLTFCTQRKRDQIENVAEKSVYFFTNLCIFSAKLLSHFIESHMYVLGKEESDFLLCHCNMDRTKRRKKT